MDPLTTVLLNALWAGPLLAGGAVVAVLGAREVRSGKHLGVSAARRDVSVASREVVSRRLEARARRAEVRRLVAEKAAPELLASVRAEAKEAERAVRVASARVRESRAQLGLAQAELRNGVLPLARLHERHDELTSRWIEYETDTAKKIEFPDLSDVRVPETAAFLDAREVAQRIRNEIAATRVNPERFSAYRDAVADMHRALDRAERAARGERPSAGENMQTGVQDLLEKSTEAIERVAGAAASALSDRIQTWFPGRKNDGTS